MATNAECGLYRSETDSPRRSPMVDWCPLRRFSARDSNAPPNSFAVARDAAGFGPVPCRGTLARFAAPMSRSQQLGCFPTSCAFAFGQKQRLVHKPIFESRWTALPVSEWHCRRNTDHNIPIAPLKARAATVRTGGLTAFRRTTASAICFAAEVPAGGSHRDRSIEHGGGRVED